MRSKEVIMALFMSILQTAQVRFQARVLLQQLVLGQSGAAKRGFATQDGGERAIYRATHGGILEAARDRVLVKGGDIPHGARLVEIIDLSTPNASPQTSATSWK